jgi:3-oxosteroid 1-dehydrogenase
MVDGSTFDVVVVGAGAAGLSTAVVCAGKGLSVLVVEKSSLLGGTAATSGSGIWLPCTHLSLMNEPHDTPEEAFQYIRALSAPNVTDKKIHAFVSHAGEMLDWLYAHTDLRLQCVEYPDYHSEIPGAGHSRTHFPMDFDGKLLGDDVNLIRETSPAVNFLGYINWTIEESPSITQRLPGWRRHLIRMLSRYYLDLPQRLRSKRDRYLTMGNALIGRLYYSACKANVQFLLKTPLQRIFVDENNRVSGVYIQNNGKEILVRASRAVVLATGGFERNASMRKQYLPRGASNPEMSGSQINNTGDGILAGVDVGATVSNLDSAWWGPVFHVPGEERGRLCSVERALPGCIIVNGAGHRYVNEALSYHVVARTMIDKNSHTAPTAPSHIIFDNRYRSKYPMGPLSRLPLWMQSRAVRSIVTTANSIDELSRKLHIPDPSTLTDTINRFNAMANAGMDTDFQRGSTPYERHLGDYRVQPNPTLAPIDKPPFFAMQLHLGDIGTNGGLDTDCHSQVLSSSGVPIQGLYATGNTSASVMGYSYPGPGVTLGPAMTFSYLAAKHISEAEK